ncbi:MAG: HAD hydrolase family protein [Candidatus Gastranaerophilales bacterium]|nr:HAD hydrolase family protein [Candidatus Gastranaerophilales bacterium]
MDNNCNIKNYSDLLKPFKIVIFDWDGTAVKNRKTDASQITSKLDELLKLGIYIIVITGTNFDNINRQFSSFIKGPHKHNLYICTNRGSEVFGFDENSDKVLLYRRIATDQENLLLNKTVEKTKSAIENTSKATINIIYNRLNRRKIDLIPEWTNPPKNEIDKLLLETEKRLEKNGFAGGIKKAYKLLTDIAKTSKFGNAKITSDVKHLEIGLTDKSDSIIWILQNIAKKYNINDNEIIIGGDEFGSIAGFEGSDSKMITKNRNDIIYFSVGIEPNGVPEKVIHFIGGPASFEKFIEEQINIQKT